MTPSRIRPGFTLIELLVVIAIIATLMGLLIPSVMFVQARAKKAKTRTFLAQIEAALNSYKNVNGVYAENIEGDPTRPMADTGQANARALYNALATVDRENFPPAPIPPSATLPLPTLKDPYGNEIAYRPAKVFAFDPVATTPGQQPSYREHIDGEVPPGADSYQLWSVGSNGIDEVASSTAKGEYGDDIVTWK